MSCITMLACQYCKPVRKPVGSLVLGLEGGLELNATGPGPELHITDPFNVGAQPAEPPLICCICTAWDTRTP